MEIMKNIIPAINKIVHFYFDGFRNMQAWGRKVWIVIIIKLFIIFIILRIFFFHDFLRKKYSNDQQRSNYVLEQITKSTDSND